MLRSFVSSLVLLGAINVVFAQPTPRLTILTPAGGQAGTSVQVTLTGVDLENTSSLMIAPGGLIAERAPNPAKPGEFLPNVFTIKIPKDQLPATFDVRAVGPWGITNPRAFVVGELPELIEKEPNNDIPQAQSVELNSTITGNIGAPNDVDYFAVNCKKDVPIQVQVAAESIDSRLEPDVRVFSTTGRLLSSSRPRAETDGHCSFTPPADGIYYIRLCAHAHVEGNAESFYRLTISSKPWIAAIYPPVVEPGKAASAALWGQQLTGATPDPDFKHLGKPLQLMNITLAPPTEGNVTQQLQGFPWAAPLSAGLDGYCYRTRNPSGWSNSYPIAYAQAPVVVESLDHGTQTKAQPVTLPCEIVGRIEKRDDRDWYWFTAKAGEVVSLEGFAERLGVPLDLYFELRRENGSIVAEYDENPEQVSYQRFFSRTDDPVARVTIPAEGKYFLMVSSRDATLRGDPRLIYRVSLHKPRPDFRAIAVDAHPINPGSLRLVPGGRQHLDVVLFRREGFTGPVQLSCEGLPMGVTCTSSTIPAGSSTGAIIFTAGDKAAEHTGTLTIKATATIDGQTVTREVRSGCLVWPNPTEQNNGIAVSRLCRSTAIAVRPGTPPLRISLVCDKTVLTVGGNQPVKLKVERLWPDAKQPININALHLPAGVTLNNNQLITLAADKNEVDVRLVINPNSTATEFPLMLRCVSQVPFAKDKEGKQKANVQMAETSTATTIKVYRQVLEVAPNPLSIDVKAGGEATTTLKFTRLHGYLGGVTLQVQGMPAGVTLSPLSIPERVSEVKLVIKANKNATGKATATVRLIGAINGVSLVTETRLNINVTK